MVTKVPGNDYLILGRSEGYCTKSVCLCVGVCVDTYYGSTEAYEASKLWETEKYDASFVREMTAFEKYGVKTSKEQYA